MARRGLFSIKKKLVKAAGGVMIEPLEIRQMLTTWVGGGLDANGNPAFNDYFYTQVDGTLMEASIGGNTTVEAIFYNGSAIDPTATGGDLFQVYVARSDINSVISIFPIDSTGDIEPFSTAAPTLTIQADSPIPGDTAQTATGESETGAGVLGGLPAASPFIPVVKQDINGIAIGVRPAGLDDLPNDPNNDLSAGLVVANGQSLGKFLFGGVVFGEVFVPGNMNLFYAGWLLTGDAGGATEGYDFISSGTVSPTGTNIPGEDGAPFSLVDGLEIPSNNFYVGGDLQNLATVGPIGWDGVYGGGAPATEESPHFLSGVDIYIGGKLGAITALDGDAASVHVADNSAIPEPVEDQQELEGLNGGTLETIDGEEESVQGDFSTGELVQYTSSGNINPFENNDFLHAQFLGSFDTSLGNNTILVDGTYDTGTDVDTDPDDYYGVGLMAGQTITIEVSGDTGSRVGVFDPNGVLIATDYDKVASGGSDSTTNVLTDDNEEPFQITASTAGEYRIAVSAEGDVEFNDFAGSNFRLLEQTSYQLAITGVGNLSVGGIVTQGTSLETNAGWRKLEVDNGDVGGIYAATNFHVTAAAEVLLNTSVTNPQLPAPESYGVAGIYLVNGDLRSFVAGAIGLGRDTTGYDDVPYSAPDLEIPAGSVGLVQALTGILELNPNNLEFDEGGTGAAALAIGGDYEVIQGAPSSTENMILGLVADGRIGIIDGPNLEEVDSVIIADADSSGDDGTIDSIDIAGNLDSAYIWHGPGGDVRFMRVGGELLDDESYAEGQGQRVVYNYNQSVTLTDDSGSTITMTPLGPSIPNPVYNASVTDPTNIESVQAFGPRLTIRTYPIASGGVCIVDVASTGGLAVTTAANGVNGVAEISRIEVSGSALAPIETLNPSTGVTSVSLPTTPYVTTSTTITTTEVTTGTLADGSTGPITTTISTPLTFSTQEITDVSISGTAVTDVANIVVLGVSALGPADFPVTPVNPVTALGNATDISNTTGGDIISVAALSIGDLTSQGNIGLGHTSIPGLALRFNSVFTVGTSIPGARSEDTDPTDGSTTNEMPVNPVSVSPSPTGSTPAGSSYPFDNQTFGIAVGGDVVDISAAMGVGNVIADGIIGQVTADSGHKNTPGVFSGIDGPIWGFGTTGAVLNVNIGQGILYSGSGDASFAGIYGDYLVGNINGTNADIRGDIISGGKILGINLTNGSLINAEVLTLAVGSESVGGASIAEYEAARQNSPFNGGYIIPQNSSLSLKPTYDIGSINVTGDGGIIGTYVLAYNIGNITATGFGIIGSALTSPFDGRIATITAGGYGIRDDSIGEGATIGGINVTGNGSELSTANVDSSVRESESSPIDPYFGVAFDPFSGRILSDENDIDAALGTSIATPVIAGVTDTGVVEDSDISGSTSLGYITAQTIRAGQVGDTTQPSDPNSPSNVNFPMQIEFGDSIGTLQTRGVIDGLRVITGTIQKFEPGSDVLALYLTTSGKIKDLDIKGSLAGDSVINASGTNGGINKVVIAHDLTGTINVTNNVSSITIGGNLTGSLNIAGSHKGNALGKLYIGGSLLGGSLNVTGNVGTVQTAGALGASGSTLTFTGNVAKILVGQGDLYANLTVGGNLGTLQVNGATYGTITVGGINGQFKSLIVNGPIDGDITVNGKLVNAKVNGANVSATINATDGITRFLILNGSLAANDTIESSLGSIGTLDIIGGDDFGSILAPAGAIKTIDITNNLGDGIDPLSITTGALNLLDVGGSILSGVKVTVSGPIGALLVGGSIEPGAMISATTHRTLSVAGFVAPGSLQIG